MIDLDFNSPVQAVDLPVLRQYDVRLYIKRDDLIHPMISGNKWRKLKYTLQDALGQNKRTLVTFGGAWSNHLLATACAGALNGLQTVGFVRGESHIQNPVLSLCRLFGMKLIFVDRTAYRDKPTLFADWLTKNAYPDAYFIDEGGYSTVALAGCMEIIGEMTTDPSIPAIDHIFCACGTGATLAGLAKGIDKYGLKSDLNGIPVLAEGQFLDREIKNLYPEARFALHTNYHFGGYAKTKPELIEFVKYFCASTGILIEPVYTGKMLYAIIDRVKSGKFHKGSSILAIHTGGMTGILGYTDQF